MSTPARRSSSSAPWTSSCAVVRASSSRIASRPSAAPTSSSSSRRATWWSGARTTSFSPGMGPTRASTTPSSSTHRLRATDAAPEESRAGRLKAWHRHRTGVYLARLVINLPEIMREETPCLVPFRERSGCQTTASPTSWAMPPSSATASLAWLRSTSRAVWCICCLRTASARASTWTPSAERSRWTSMWSSSRASTCRPWWVTSPARSSSCSSRLPNSKTWRCACT